MIYNTVRTIYVYVQIDQSVDSIEDAGSFHLNSTETTNNDPETSSEIALDDNKHPVSVSYWSHFCVHAYACVRACTFYSRKYHSSREKNQNEKINL